MKICHFTTVHPREDVRIFYKECSFLAQLGYNVTLLVADGKGDEIKNNITIIDIGGYRFSRFKRLVFGRKKMLKQALSLNCDLYHFHDPELLTIGLKLKRKNKTVVYDCHEDVGKQILYKTWLGNLSIRKILSSVYTKYEQRITKQLDGVISVIDEITDKFSHPNKITIKNYPILSSIALEKQPINLRKNYIVYLGSLSKVRGIKDYIEAMAFIPKEYTLLLIGSFSSSEFEQECRSLPEWNRVRFEGFKPMNEAIQVMAQSKIALSVLHPEKNYLTSLPTKGFEYMAAGLPMIMSDFSYWRPYFEDCAIFVTPKTPNLLAKKINALIDSPELYEKLVNNCEEKTNNYSWEKEAKKLNQFYQSILNM